MATDKGKIPITYEVMSAGSALVERVVVEGMPMETIFYLDGPRLLLTHYCLLGNQPRMQARAYNPATGELAFEFLDATNLASPGAAHMHNVTLHFVDADHLVNDWQLFEDGHLKSTEHFQAARVK